MGAAKATFSSLREIQPNCITFSAVLVGYPDRGRVEIGPEAWHLASIGIDTFEIGIVEDGFDFNQRWPETPLQSLKGIIPEAPAAAAPPQAADPGRYDELPSIFFWFCHCTHLPFSRSSNSRAGMTSWPQTPQAPAAAGRRRAGRYDDLSSLFSFLFFLGGGGVIVFTSLFLDRLIVERGCKYSSRL